MTTPGTISGVTTAAPTGGMTAGGSPGTHVMGPPDGVKMVSITGKDWRLDVSHVISFWHSLMNCLRGEVQVLCCSWRNSKQPVYTLSVLALVVQAEPP